MSLVVPNIIPIVIRYLSIIILREAYILFHSLIEALLIGSCTLHLRVGIQNIILTTSQIELDQVSGVIWREIIQLELFVHWPQSHGERGLISAVIAIVDGR